MKLNNQQVELFRTFGFIKIVGALESNIEEIADEFDRLIAQHEAEYPHDGLTRTLMWQFIDRSPMLSKLLDDPRIEAPLISLLGDDFQYLGGSGNLYAGDTGWHTDADFYSIEDSYRHQRAKVIVYLDSLSADSGALRVVPGTHFVNDFTRSVLRGISRTAEEWSLEGYEVPSVTIAVKPGDLIVFDQNLVHSAWGGGARRRMFSMVGHRKYSAEHLPLLRRHIGGLARFWCERVHGDPLRSEATAPRMRHLEQVIANEGDLPKLCQIARNQMLLPSRDNPRDFANRWSPSLDK